MAAEEHATVTTEVGAGDDAVADAVDLERRCARPQSCLDEVGEGGFVVALRPDRAQRGRQVEEIAGVGIDDRVRRHAYTP
jgi:hypothetical protein